MRAGECYECTRCGGFGFGMTCIQCGGTPVDEFGNEPPPHFRRVAYPNTSFERLAVLVGGLNQRWKVHRLFGSKASGTVQHRGKLWAKTVGTVRLIEPINFIDSPLRREHLEGVACYRVSREVSEISATLEVHQGCGRFMIAGDLDVFVDEDFLNVLPRKGSPLVTRQVAVRDGDLVEAYGPVVERSLVELGVDDVAGSGYRGAGKVLCFEGSTENLVSLRPVGAFAQG